jgi:outer membrane protein TolC
MIRPAGVGNLRSRGQVQDDGTLLIPPDVPAAEMVTPPPYRPVEPSFQSHETPVDPDSQSRAIYPDEPNPGAPPTAEPSPDALRTFSPDNGVSNSAAPYSADPFDSRLNFEPPPQPQPSYQPPAAEHPHGHVIAPRPGFGRPEAYFAPGASGFRATVECDAPPWMDPYYGRTARMPAGREGSPTPSPSVQLPADFVAWWDPLVRQSAGLAPQTLPVEVATLVQQALANAPQVQALQADPEVQYTIVRQEEATFDWRSFLEAKYSDLSDPVGNELTLGPGGGNRFIDNKVHGQGGLKRRTTSGGELSIAQSIGHEYSNSRFLQPNAQSTSRLELSFRQPLLSKAGTVYNQNQIVLAGINSNISSDETLQELQSHLYQVAEAYWNLYRARSEFFQRQKLLASAQKVLQTLEGRHQVDTIPRQILRARAAVARAESRMQRAVTDIRNGESQLRLLVNDPSMINCGPLEFTPAESPAAMPSPTGLQDTLQTALVNRPDISRAIRQMRVSSVQVGVSKSELLPKLDFIVSSYVAGLQAQSQIGPSINDQFTAGRPGYTAGFEFEVPLGNRAAKARMEQRQWELKRAISAFRVTVETSLTEVEIATREVDTSYREMLGKYQAMFAAQNEVAYLQDRFNTLPMIEDSTMLLLEDLLGGYERLADEESAFVQAQTGYALSLIQLRRATGTLMRSRHESPDIQPEENEWMTARAEQTVEETERREIRTASFRSTPAQDDSGRPPAEWSRPVSAPEVRVSGPNSPNHQPVQRNSPVRPATYGGHSFGTR